MLTNFYNLAQQASRTAIYFDKILKGGTNDKSFNKTGEIIMELGHYLEQIKEKRLLFTFGFIQSLIDSVYGVDFLEIPGNKNTEQTENPELREVQTGLEMIIESLNATNKDNPNNSELDNARRLCVKISQCSLTESNFHRDRKPPHPWRKDLVA